MPQKKKPDRQRTTREDQGIGVGEEGFEQDLGENIPERDVRQGQGSEQRQRQQGTERQGEGAGTDSQERSPQRENRDEGVGL